MLFLNVVDVIHYSLYCFPLYPTIIDWIVSINIQMLMHQLSFYLEKWPLWGLLRVNLEEFSLSRHARWGKVVRGQNEEKNFHQKLNLLALDDGLLASRTVGKSMFVV